MPREQQDCDLLHGSIRHPPDLANSVIFGSRLEIVGSLFYNET
jgi:hypothetical protein